MQVYNKHDGNIPKDVVYVGRPTKWGNPWWPKSNEAERNASCDKYETYATLRAQAEPEWIAPLRGKDLVCWCAPSRCHADTLIRLANKEETT